MPWCPKCRNEYYEGFTVCADCGEQLVDELPAENAAEVETTFLTEEDKRRMVAFSEMLQENSEAEESEPEYIEMEEEAEEKPSYKKGVYRNYAERAEDNKSSAATLLLVGSIGLLAIILAACNIIPIPINSTSKFMVYGVMGFMFVVFIVMGFVSSKNAKEYARKAASEADLTMEIQKWCKESLSADSLDEGLFSEEEADFTTEQKFFKRSEKLKKCISERFLNLDEEYLERFVDEHYQDIFQ